MESLARLANGLCHDFNNLVTIVDGHATLLAALDLPKDAELSVAEIKEAAKRVSALCQRMMLFTQRSRLKLTEFRLSELILENWQELCDRIGSGMQLHFQCDSSEVRIHADAQLLLLVLEELLSNASTAMQRTGEITLTASCLPDGQFLISVVDSGAGIAPEVMPRIFEPYYTTRPKGSGKGLGLAFAYGIACLHGGSITAESVPGVRTCFEIKLPGRSTPRPIPVESPILPNASLESKSALPPLVFLVEDDRNLATLIQYALQRDGCELVVASSATLAKKIWDARFGEIDLAIIDMGLPEGRIGVELAADFVAKKATLKVILMSGVSGRHEEQDQITHLGFSFLPKPFDFDQLGAIVRRSLAAR